MRETPTMLEMPTMRETPAMQRLRRHTDTSDASASADCATWPPANRKTPRRRVWHRRRGRAPMSRGPIRFEPPPPAGGGDTFAGPSVCFERQRGARRIDAYCVRCATVGPGDGDLQSLDTEPVHTSADVISLLVADARSQPQKRSARVRRPSGSATSRTSAVSGV
jgi:hypothetical protein